MYNLIQKITGFSTDDFQIHFIDLVTRKTKETN